MARVTTESALRSAITLSDPEIIVANDIVLSTYVSINYAVTIKGETSGLSLFWRNPSASIPYMFYVGSTGTLTLEDITLDGEARDGTLVQLAGGTLITNDGAILKNIESNSAYNAVKIGTQTTSFGGTFTMNGGLVTGVSSSEAVLCRGGVFTMNNDAEISGNTSVGITVLASIDREYRGKLTMTGRSRVTGNRSRYGGAGIAVYISDMYMGVNEGDAPEVSDNQPPSGSFAGGVILVEGSTLTMRYDSKISGNYTDYIGGGLVAQDAEITMSENASIVNNVCDGTTGGGGVRLHQNTKLTLNDNANISGNTSVGYGGGIYMQPGSYLELQGEASLFDNEAANGAGVYMSSNPSLLSSAKMGVNNSSPQIRNNIATEKGGGIFIVSGSELNLFGKSRIFDNIADKGAGIYKEGVLNLSQAPQVLDGLFFEDLSLLGTPRAVPPVLSLAAELDGADSTIKFSITEQAGTGAAALQAYTLQDPTYTDNVPIIVDQHSPLATIQLESSGHVNPPNVPLVIADKGEDYELLCETDRAAWLIPRDFGEGYSVILNDELDQVLIAYQIYNIEYCHLFGADNPNPDSYSIDSEFPIVLQKPGEREGYIFDGWYDSTGQLVTEITEDTIGDIILIAVWRKKRRELWLRFNGNAPCVCEIPDQIRVQDGEMVTIPSILPKKPGHCFVGWNTQPLGGGKDYAPNDRIMIKHSSVTLYALWMPVCSDRRYERLYCPKNDRCY